MLFNPYTVLNLSVNCTQAEVEKKFRELAIKYHPDKNQESDAKQKFEDIFKAKEILIDPIKRNKYDEYKIIDDNDEILFQEAKMMIQLIVNVSDILVGITKTISLAREIINNKQMSKEIIKVELKINDATPINIPIEIKGKGKIINGIVGNLYVILKISSDDKFKIDPTTFNIITKQKISIIQALCGFRLTITRGSIPINIYYDNCIKHSNAYIIKNNGLTLSNNNIITKSDIELVFDIQYDDITDEIIQKLKQTFKYKYTCMPTDYKIQEINNEEIPPMQIPYVNMHQQMEPVECRTQ